MKSRKNISIRLAACVFMLVLALTVPAGAVTRYVPFPHPTIQGAIDASAMTGDEIEVAPGIYYGAINFNGKAVRLYSSGGPEVTTIDGIHDYHVVQCVSGEDANTILQGFTITGGSAIDFFGYGYPDNCGGGMYNYYSSPTVIDCNFTYNEADFNGGGIYNEGGSPTVTNCTFNWNFTGYSDPEVGNGAGMYNYQSNPKVTNCKFIYNDSWMCAGGMYNSGSSPNLTNCTFSRNSAWQGGGAMHNHQSSPTVTNCTFSGNWAVDGGGMYNFDSNPTVTNCVLWGDTSDEIVDTGSSSTTVTYSDVQGGWSGAGNINTDPLFVNVARGDLRLVSYFSPCVDAGNNIVVTEPNDLAGNPRVVDGDEDGTATVDMGAYEFNGGPVRNLRLNLSNLSYLGIQAAIDDPCTVNGDQIEVAPGTYYEAINFSGKAVHLYSSGGPEVTTIDATWLYSSVVSCISDEGLNTIIEGFTITGGNATYGGGMYNQGISSPTVTNCVFIDNDADDGGGMYCEGSSPMVKYCHFTANRATGYGGGMSNRGISSPTVTNCIFTGNTAGNNGGGMSNRDSSSPMVTNCTLSGNLATNGGGIYNDSSSSSTVTNCILWGNTTNEIVDNFSTTTVSYSDIQGGYIGTGNINANPFFTDAQNGDMRLRACSPCVDSGNNAAVPGGITTDLDGNPRFVDDTTMTDTGAGTPPIVDMGSYERQLSIWPIYNMTKDAGYCSIQMAINDANDGDEIEVEPWTYNEAINFNGKAVRLYSSGGPDVTTIDGTGNYHVVQCVSGEDPNTILEGFTITGGNANGGSHPDWHGGGMYCEGSSPTVMHCIVKGNSAEYGGGMSNVTSSPIVTNCILSDNSAGDGGGMFNYISSPTVTNCTFIYNRGDLGGGMFNERSSPTLTNCILWGNTPDEIYNYSSSPTVTYCDIQGGWPGEGNINQNPLLRNVPGGDMSLAPWSPCIDMGNNDVVAPDAIDITGQPRLVDGDCNGTVIVDIGARELQRTYGGDFDSSCLVNMADYAVLAWAWLTTPQSETWDPVCDISTPADGRIDAGDVRILTGNWLQSIETPVTCDAERLKDEFGLDAAGAIYVLKEVCGITDTFTVEQMLYAAGYKPEEYLEVTALESIYKFAPVLYFDLAHRGLPMSAQVYFETMMSPSPDVPEAGMITWTTPWDGPCGEPGVECLWGRDECTCGMQNNVFTTLKNGQIPTYYKVISDIDSYVDTGPKGRLRIWYWWFYGFQGPCYKGCDEVFCCGPDGAHHGDWEHIIVTTDPGRTYIDAVTYSFHSEWYTRQRGGFDSLGDRPVVYVGKVAHGNYHSNETSCLFTGEKYFCCPYADCRTPDDNTKWYNAYQNLISLSGNSEPWMLADRVGSLYEYYGREYTISQWRWGPHISYCWDLACTTWHHTSACGNHPTVALFDWTKASCGGVEGCGTDRCIFPDWFDEDYPVFIDYDEGWPWESGFMSSAADSAKLVKTTTPVTGGAVASCGSCGASRFGALVQLGDYWLVTP